MRKIHVCRDIDVRFVMNNFMILSYTKFRKNKRNIHQSYGIIEHSLQHCEEIYFDPCERITNWGQRQLPQFNNTWLLWLQKWLADLKKTNRLVITDNSVMEPTKLTINLSYDRFIDHCATVPQCSFQIQLSYHLNYLRQILAKPNVELESHS